MLIITIPTTDDTTNDLDILEQVTTILDCYTGDNEVHIKFLESGIMRVFRMPQKVNDDVDMLELLYDIEGIEVEIE